MGPTKALVLIEHRAQNSGGRRPKRVNEQPLITAATCRLCFLKSKRNHFAKDNYFYQNFGHDCMLWLRNDLTSSFFKTASEIASTLVRRLRITYNDRSGENKAAVERIQLHNGNHKIDAGKKTVLSL